EADTIAAHRTLVAKPVERGLEILERDVGQVIRQSGRGEVPERERGEAARGEERGERFADAAARAADDDERGRRGIGPLEECPDQTAVADLNASHVGRDREALEGRARTRASVARSRA